LLGYQNKKPSAPKVVSKVFFRLAANAPPTKRAAASGRRWALSLWFVWGRIALAPGA